MKHIKLGLIAYILAFFVLINIGCNGNKAKKIDEVNTEHQEQSNMMSNQAVFTQVVVQQHIPTTKYSYMEVTEGENVFWIASPKAEINVGDTVYFSEAMEMKDFKGKEIDKTFDVIYFVQGVFNEPIAKTQQMENPHSEQIKGEKADVDIKPVEGGISVAELYKNKDKYAGKTVKLTGKVVKYNEAIMNKNWIHIQDGSEHDGLFDVTITSTDAVKEGDIVVLEGTVVLDKDFGAGYKYNVIVEDAKLLK